MAPIQWNGPFHKRYILTNLATFRHKAMVELEDVSSTAPRAQGSTVPAQCRLSRRLFCAVSGREAALSAGRTAADSSVNEYETAFPSTDCLEL